MWTDNVDARVRSRQKKLQLLMRRRKPNIARTRPVVVVVVEQGGDVLIHRRAPPGGTDTVTPCCIPSARCRARCRRRGVGRGEHHGRGGRGVRHPVGGGHHCAEGPSDDSDRDGCVVTRAWQRYVHRKATAEGSSDRIAPTCTATSDATRCRNNTPANMSSRFTQRQDVSRLLESENSQRLHTQGTTTNT